MSLTDTPFKFVAVAQTSPIQANWANDTHALPSKEEEQSEQRNCRISDISPLAHISPKRAEKQKYAIVPLPAAEAQQ